MTEVVGAATADAPAVRAGRHRLAGLRWWLPLALFATTRIYNAFAIMIASRAQIAVDGRTFDGMYVHTAKPADPGYWAVITNWDGQWYEFIAVDGYQVPRTEDPDPAATAWAWAFPPLFPMVVRALMAAVPLSFPEAAAVVSLLFGALAMVLLYRVLERQGGTFLAMSGVALTCCFISAPLLQAAYSESLGLFLLIGVFWAMTQQRYWLATVVIVALAFTRLITPPLAVVVLALGLAVRSRRTSGHLSRREVLGLSIVGISSVLGVWLWSGLSLALAPTSTGATTRTTLSGDTTLGWFSESYAFVGWPGPIVVALVPASFALLAKSRWTCDWGTGLRTWLWAYPLYVLVATPITGGILRYLLLCPPLAMLAAGSQGLMSRSTRTALVAAACVLGLVLQWWWISRSLVITTDYLMP